MMDALDKKVLEVFEGKVVRKDLLHRIKKGTNVPTFVLEFFLARFCASSDPEEIKAGTEAVLETLKDNYVRPDESNAAQSYVATHGKHRFIDKIHVRYVEKDKKHWASLENFNSQRIAINEKFFADHTRMLEGGIWAEITIGHNDMDEDYAFYVEDIRPIQLSRFDFDGYCEGRAQFTRNEWLDVLLRAVGLEPSTLNHRSKMHFLLRLAPLVEQNYNFIELGPRGTGKSYFYSEFSPYSTLVSGGQATKATLFYNNQRKRVGLVGFWDNIAFDEVAGIKISDPEAIQIMKDFMANGRFSRGTEIIADASLSFVGNIDESVEQLVNSPEHDLFISLPKELDLAVMDRFACYLPGWEMPKTSSKYLTDNYGLITDYLAEAFHHCFVATSRYEEVSSRVKLGSSVEGRDEKGIKKTICAFVKMLHPHGSPTDTEFEEYVAYSIEMRRRVKEQMNKRKPDDEFANIDLSYINSDNKEIVVYCPESKPDDVEELAFKPIRSKVNVSEASVDEIVKAGESGELEFKSSLRWDMRKKSANKKLEMVIVKTVAAFANSIGGSLLIGVNDDGEALGLDLDYGSLRGDSDKFEIHLRNLLNEAFDKAFVSTSVKIGFPLLQEKEICRVDVIASDTPRIAKIKEDGPVSEKFYVRSGNSTQELSFSEFDTYRQQHFG